MRIWKSIFATVALATVGLPAAQAASVTCGDLNLGTRQTTVDPALACTYAGLTNLGDSALVSLMNSILGVTDSTIIDRDTANNNGGLLVITGVGGTAGTWSIDASSWNYGRVFLYFHFGDGPDTGGATDPDIFIVELMSPTTSGTWSFNGQQGLSNIASIGSGDSDTDTDSDVPEPGTLALLGLGLLGLGAARRRMA